MKFVKTNSIVVLVHTLQDSGQYKHHLPWKTACHLAQSVLKTAVTPPIVCSHFFSDGHEMERNMRVGMAHNRCLKCVNFKENALTDGVMIFD